MKNERSGLGLENKKEDTHTVRPSRVEQAEAWAGKCKRQLAAFITPLPRILSTPRRSLSPFLTKSDPTSHPTPPAPGRHGSVCARSAVTVWSWVDAAGRQGRRTCGSPLSMGGCGRHLSGSPGSGGRRPSLTGWAGLPASPNRFAALQGLHDDFQLRPVSPSLVRIHKTSQKIARGRAHKT